MLAQMLRPGEVANVEDGLVRDQRRGGDERVEDAAQMLADADDQRAAGFGLHLCPGDGRAGYDVQIGYQVIAPRRRAAKFSRLYRQVSCMAFHKHSRSIWHSPSTSSARGLRMVGRYCNYETK
jgi:hypothetical protein